LQWKQPTFPQPKEVRQCSSFSLISRVFIIPQGQTAQFIMWILKPLLEAVHRKWPELWPSDWTLDHDNALAHKASSAKQFLAQNFITEMEHPPCYPDLAHNDFCLFLKVKSALKG
jgi:hypothetical protein